MGGAMQYLLGSFSGRRQLVFWFFAAILAVWFVNIVINHPACASDQNPGSSDVVHLDRSASLSVWRASSGLLAISKGIGDEAPAQIENLAPTPS
jgi:hypothetical protein